MTETLAEPRLRFHPLTFLEDGLHAVLVLGRIHPDEVYQVIEPAFERVHGYGILAWEWDLARGGGIRNWAPPFFFAALLKVCALLGIDNPRAYRAVLELPQFGLHLAMLWAVFRYARRRVDDDRWALLGVALVALHGLVVLFAGRTMSESFSAAFLVLAVEAVDRAYHGELDGKALRNAGLLAGLWLGLSVVARYGSAVMVVALLLYIAATGSGGCCSSPPRPARPLRFCSARWTGRRGVRRSTRSSRTSNSM